LLFCDFLYEGKLQEVVLGTPALQVYGDGVVSVGSGEVLVEISAVAELSLDDVFEGFEFVLVDVDHLEFTGDEGVGHVVQHLRFELIDGMDDLFLDFLNASIVDGAVDLAFLEQYLLVDAHCFSFLQQPFDPVGFAEFVRDVFDVGRFEVLSF
jgi:hypothetical protein